MLEKCINVSWRGRGYNKTILDTCLEKARTATQDLLNSKPKEKGATPLARVSIFSPNSKGLKDSIKRHWHILRSDPNIGHVFKHKPRFTDSCLSHLMEISGATTQQLCWL